MTKKAKVDNGSRDARLEHRVWGKHPTAHQLLRQLASDKSHECIHDRYLLVDDPIWNAKVRDKTLKVKQLVAEHKGFERWVTTTHRSAKTVPPPLHRLFEGVDLKRMLHSSGHGPSKSKDKSMDGLDPDLGTRSVFVTKYRRRYRIGDLRAEVTEIKIADTNEVLYTLAIEGHDLQELVALRRRLGLRDEPNTAVHRAIDPNET